MEVTRIADSDMLPEELPQFEARKYYFDVDQSPGRRKQAGAILGYNLSAILLHEATIPFKRVVRYFKYFGKAA